MTMSALAVIPASNVWSGAQLSLIKRTVATDCNAQEFDLFVTVAQNAGLDPFRKQISALVFNKNKPDKRRMAIVTTIDGLRVIAARSRRYRPDEDEPEFVADPAMKSETNPLGLEKALVRIWIADDMREGGWKRVTGVAYWDEFAPVSDEWGEDEATGRRKPTGRKVLDTGGNWGRMPRLMLAKCAESQALRKAFPEDLSSLYERAELDQAIAGDMLPSEQVEAAAVETRLARIGGGGILFQFMPNEPLESVPVGKIADRVIGASKEFTSTKHQAWFESVNRAAMQEFWARAQADALEVKKVLERRAVELKAAEAETADA
jgi:phage recombination protein Bet